ncbi:MAG TPA: cytochrome b [Novimethylophilus sp.]|jgi:cytochrome b561|uniref:cytochrome b n=1 Tax=Novimethylophilus sp. TaxID=2137426 RepID=UPI002F3ECAB8
MNTPARYSGIAIALHWLIALAVVSAFTLGIYMHDLPLSPHKLKLYSYHKWIGITVLGLMLARIGWRISHIPPPPLEMPEWQRSAVQAVHLGLYLLLLVVPLSGWLMSSALGFKVVWMGLVPLPDLIAKNKELGEILKEVHKSLDFVLLGLLTVHIAAALKHHFVDRDGTLQRMLPSFSRKSQ